jgi:hypothetical protein
VTPTSMLPDHLSTRRSILIWNGPTSQDMSVHSSTLLMWTSVACHVLCSRIAQACKIFYFEYVLHPPSTLFFWGGGQNLNLFFILWHT